MTGNRNSTIVGVCLIGQATEIVIFGGVYLIGQAMQTIILFGYI